jgi:hypothetical protein
MDIAAPDVSAATAAEVIDAVVLLATQKDQLPFVL